jgi:Uma2 family endonuclease
MSTITPMQPMATPTDFEWVPSPLYRLTLEQYEAMVASGVFSTRDRFHLINGYLVAKMTQNDPHCTADDLCGEALDRVIPDGWYVRASKPIRLPGQISKPEPDRCMVRGKIRDYRLQSPGAADVNLVVEVSDSSLSEDRRMAHVYGASGIPVYWIVNLVDRQVEVYTGPCATGYSRRADFVAGQVIPVLVAGIEVGFVAVSDILP